MKNVAAILKYLRIAVTALSLTARVLLIALWVRNFWWADVAWTPLARIAAANLRSETLANL